MPLDPIPVDKVMGVIAKLGPVQPIDVRRELGIGDSVLIGAMLSQLAAERRVAITRTKRGGSPFYYDPARPESLERLSQFLPEKDRQTCAFLREQGVVREDALDPLTRVGMQNIPDFSRRLTLVHDGQERAYWRYYLVGEEDARARAMGDAGPATQARAPDAARAAQPQEQLAPQPAAPAAVQGAQPPAPAQQAPPARAQEVQASLGGEKAETPAKPKRARARKAKALAPEPAAAAAAPAADELAQGVERFARAEKGTLSAMHVGKPGAELTCTLTVAGPYGPLALLVYACAKKPSDKALMRALLLARGQGMPLLVLSPEGAPKRSPLDDVENVSFRKLG